MENRREKQDKHKQININNQKENIKQANKKEQTNRSK